MLNLKVRCQKCREVLTPIYTDEKIADAKNKLVNISARMPRLVDGKKYYVTSYVCPCCGSVNVVQVDDDLTIKTFDNIVQLAGRKLRATNNGTLTEKEEKRISRKAHNLNAYLDARRVKLYKKYCTVEWW